MLAFFVIILPRSPLPPAGTLPAILTGFLKGLLGAFTAIPGPPVIHYFVRSGVRSPQVFYRQPYLVACSNRKGAWAVSQAPRETH
jgi:hypothetical protein